MKNLIANIVVLFVVVVALLGQAMAYATMSCGMTMQKTDMTLASHAEMKHSNMMHSNTEHSAMSHADIKHASVHHHEISHEEMQHHHAQMSSSDEHCASECECPAGTCNGFSWLAVEPLGMSNNVLNATIQSFTQSHYNLIQTSLYRPPIFA